MFKNKIKNNKDTIQEKDTYIKKLKKVQKTDVKQTFNKLKYKLLS